MRQLLRYVSLCLCLVGISAHARGDEPDKSIALLATGGTIAGVTTSAGGAYQSGVVGAEAMLLSVPQLESLARFITVQVANIGSQDMTDEVWLDLAREVKAQIDGGEVSGIVITHGTDTLEETAFFLDLLFPSTIPIVLTAAMRPSDSLGADGPFNLLTAVKTALAEDAARLGVLVVMNGKIHAARRVTKTHTENVAAMASIGGGALGEIVEGEPVFFRPLPKRPEFLVDEWKIPDALPRVDILYSHAGMNAGLVEFLVADGAEGIVLAGVGNGNARQPVITALAKAVASDVVVVRSSRLMSGWVSRNVEIDDEALGFVVSRDLNPAKARALLKLAVMNTRNPTDIQRLFDCALPTFLGTCLETQSP